MPVKVAHAARRLDGWQQRSPVVAIPIAVIKKFVDDGADALGVQVAYWGFFSVFALLLVFASISAGRGQTYGGFAAVVGLLSWLLIASELILIAAELNVVLARKLWPRSLTGELLPPDRQALRDSARAAQLDARQHIAVSFGQREELPGGGEPGEARSQDDA